jgi:hypothetical protein
VFLSCLGECQTHEIHRRIKVVFERIVDDSDKLVLPGIGVRLNAIDLPLLNPVRFCDTDDKPGSEPLQPPRCRVFADYANSRFLGRRAVRVRSEKSHTFRPAGRVTP